MAAIRGLAATQDLSAYPHQLEGGDRRSASVPPSSHLSATEPRRTSADIDAHRQTIESCGALAPGRAAAKLPRTVSSVPARLLALAPVGLGHRQASAISAPYRPSNPRSIDTARVEPEPPTTEEETQSKKPSPVTEVQLEYAASMAAIAKASPDALIGKARHPVHQGGVYRKLEDMMRDLLVSRLGVRGLSAEELKRITQATHSVWFWLEITPVRWLDEYKDFDYTMFYHCVLVLQSMASDEGLCMQIPIEKCPEYEEFDADGKRRVFKPHADEKYTLIERNDFVKQCFPSDKELRSLLDCVRVNESGNKSVKVSKKRARESTPRIFLVAGRLKLSRRFMYCVLADYIRIIKTQD